MKRIPLTQGKFALVDDTDYERLLKYKWHYMRPTKAGRFDYASTAIKLPNGKWVNLSMHRLILGLQYGDKSQVEHVNENGLDNRRSNLRIGGKTCKLCKKPIDPSLGLDPRTRFHPECYKEKGRVACRNRMRTYMLDPAFRERDRLRSRKWKMDNKERHNAYMADYYQKLVLRILKSHGGDIYQYITRKEEGIIRSLADLYARQCQIPEDSGVIAQDAIIILAHRKMEGKKTTWMYAIRWIALSYYFKKIRDIGTRISKSGAHFKQKHKHSISASSLLDKYREKPSGNLQAWAFDTEDEIREQDFN